MRNHLKTVTWGSAAALGGGLVLTAISLIAGSQVRYWDYLLWFNLLAIGMLIAGGVALALSLWGSWQARFRSFPLLAINGLALAFLVLLFLDR